MYNPFELIYNILGPEEFEAQQRKFMAESQKEPHGKVEIPDRLVDKPSTSFHGDLYVVRVYTDESADCHVYTHVKHLWWKNNGQTVCICHYYEDMTYRFVYWNAGQYRWMQMTPERFEQGRSQ